MLFYLHAEVTVDAENDLHPDAIDCIYAATILELMRGLGGWMQLPFMRTLIYSMRV